MGIVLSPILYQRQQHLLVFMCPACETTHEVRTGPGDPWTYTGTPEAPTFDPSVLVRVGHFADPKLVKKGRCKLCISAVKRGKKSVCSQCHSFVRGGQITFLPDCTHAFASLTVPIPPLPDHLIDRNVP